MADSKVITTWRPDTCRCELNYSWDRHTSEDERIHTAESFTPCEAHKHHTDKHQHFAAVLEENQRKNQVVNLLAEKHGIKPTEYKFSFTAERVLQISHSSLDVSKFQDEVDQIHGKDKVKLSNG